jgi:hypothetical protein
MRSPLELLALAASPTLLFAATQLPACAATCQALDTRTEESHGTFTYVVSSDITSQTVVSHGTMVPGIITVDATSASTIDVLASFQDKGGATHTVSLQLEGVPPNGTVTLTSASQACVDGVTPCAPLEGTVTTSQFATDCQADGCALGVEGSLSVTASWPGGSFSTEMTLDHLDVWENQACPQTASSYTDGTPGS